VSPALRRFSSLTGNKVNKTLWSDHMFGCNFCAVDENEGALRPFHRLGDLWHNGEDGDDTEEESEVEKGMVLNIDTDTMIAMRQSALNQRLDAAVKGMQCVLEDEGLSVSHVKGDRYSVNDRNVRLQLLQTPCEFAHLTKKFGFDAAKRAAVISVVDGPLHQPLLDYLLQTGRNENYDMRGTENPCAVTGVGRQLEFLVENPTNIGDPEEASRMEAMRQATMQADLRQRAAGTAGSVSIIQEPMRSARRKGPDDKSPRRGGSTPRNGEVLVTQHPTLRVL